MSVYRTQTDDADPEALDTLIHLLCSASVRAKLSEFTVSSDASPVEQTTEYTIVRTTDAGTTPVDGSLDVVKSDPLSAAAGVTAEGRGYATEPSIGDIMYRVSVHQKATFRWVAYPGREIISSPAASNGIGLTVINQTSAYTLNASVEWEE